MKTLSVSYYVVSRTTVRFFSVPSKHDFQRRSHAKNDVDHRTQNQKPGKTEGTYFNVVLSPPHMQFSCTTDERSIFIVFFIALAVVNYNINYSTYYYGSALQNLIVILCSHQSYSRKFFFLSLLTNYHMFQARPLNSIDNKSNILPILL